MSRKTIQLSAIVIAKDEATRIGKCLAALSFADEVLVLDNGSTDDTVAVAKKYGARVISVRADDFAKIRDAGASEAGGVWMLYIDADEVLASDLAAAIERAVHARSGQHAGYEIHRCNYYLGKRWPKGEWMLRLFRKSAFSGWEGKIHETPLITGTVGRLRGDLLHDTHRTLSEMVEKTNEWSEAEAALRLGADHPPVTWWRILRVMWTGFSGSYIKQGGWRAGTVGIVESVYQAFSMFITYAKLWERQQKAGRV